MKSRIRKCTESEIVRLHEEKKTPRVDTNSSFFFKNMTVEDRTVALLNGVCQLPGVLFPTGRHHKEMGNS